MANPTPAGRGLWLPAGFLADDDVLMDKENFNNHGLCFPSEFPYEFGPFVSSSTLNSPVESVVGSTESESDEDDSLSGLTRQLARSSLQGRQNISYAAAQNHEKKPWVLSGSPQSTLTAVGSWSGRSAASSNGSPNGPSQVPSPKTTLLGGNGIEDAWDLIYAAAGQVAMLKMNGDGPPVKPSPVMKTPLSGRYSIQTQSKANHFQQVGQEQVLKPCSGWGRQANDVWYPEVQIAHNGGSRVGIGGEGGGCGRPLGLPQSAWPPLQNQHRNPTQQQRGSGMRTVFVSGSDGGVKRECAGTGVFLPRRYATPNTIESRKKTGCSTALLPARVVQALNKNFDDLTAHVQPQPQPQPHSRFHGGFIPDYSVLMARRDALLAQQKQRMCPEGAMNHEIRLPQEWTY